MIVGEAFCVATVGEAHRAAFHSTISKLPGQWYLVSSPSEIEGGFLDRVKPRAIFFPHWRWRVPPEIVAAYECIAFHSTDLPFGRGGSPIQNLIQIGKTTTKLTAFRMTNAFDAGPIYMQRDLSLEGPAHQIFERVASLVVEMITQILDEWPVPKPQIGEPTYFKRRTPAQSVITSANNARELYDLVRMLDAPDYPHAFIEVGNFRIEFKDAALVGDGVVEAKAIVTEKQK